MTFPAFLAHASTLAFCAFVLWLLLREERD